MTTEVTRKQSISCTALLRAPAAFFGSVMTGISR